VERGQSAQWDHIPAAVCQLQVGRGGLSMEIGLILCLFLIIAPSIILLVWR
jgi:hypothetical protein